MIFLIVFAVILVVALGLKFAVGFGDPAKATSRSLIANMPSDFTENDKIIVVEDVNDVDIKKALTELCNLYNQDSFSTLPRLWNVSPDRFAVTFPYDIGFIGFCFAVNFLKYPSDIKWNAKVRAWATTRADDEWITNESANKNVMLFLAEDDNEYDNVFMTTQDNIGYKLGFAMSKTKQPKPLNIPNEYYKAPTIKSMDLKDQSHEDFK